MTTTVDDDLAQAVVALVDARLQQMATPAHAFEADDAPQSGSGYVVVTLSRRFGGNGRVFGGLSPSAWRMTARAVGSGMTNARIYLAVASQAIEQKRVTVGGVTSTPIQFETEDPIGQDDLDQSLYSGLRTYTFSF